MTVIRRYMARVEQILPMRDDGDTFRCLLDLGHRTYADARIRLIRINAPDKSRGYSQAEVDASRDYRRGRFDEALRSKLDFFVETVKRDENYQSSFERYLSEVYIEGVNINDEMVALGFAEPS